MNSIAAVRTMNDDRRCSLFGSDSTKEVAGPLLKNHRAQDEDFLPWGYLVGVEDLISHVSIHRFVCKFWDIALNG